ncbi:coiled-coil domain-containing protein 92 [Aplochiton taeniatus]
MAASSSSSSSSSSPSSVCSGTMENQLHSAQKNLLFLQQDHANTLRGLHAEIRRLQQHCTDLTYELTIRTSDPSDGSEARCRELHRKCEELEAQLKASEEENAALLRDLEQKNAMISVLENTIKEREKKYLDELKTKSHKLAALSGELEQRASTIAYLTAQLHATKKKLLAGGGGAGGGGGGGGGGCSSSDVSPNASPVVGCFRPTPPPAKDRPTGQHPQGPQGPDTPRRRMKKSLSQPLHPELTEVYRLGSDGRRVVLRETLDAMPDPTPFLQAREAPPSLSDAAQVVRERPGVIPPIASCDRSPLPQLMGLSPSSASPRHSPARDRDPHRHQRAHVGVAHRIHHHPAPPAPAPTHPELETLAVDQVNGGKVVRKRSGADRTV